MGGFLQLRGEKAESVTPCAFGHVKGLVRILEQVVHLGGIAGVEGDANAGRHKHLLGTQLEHLAHGAQKLLHDQPHVVGFVHLGEDHGKFIAPHAGHGVGFAQAALNAAGRLNKQQIAAVVAQRVVDLFEVVQVDEQNGQLLAIAPTFLDFLLQPFPQHAAVGQAGERIKIGLLANQGLGFFALGYILQHGGALDHAAALPRRGGDHVHADLAPFGGDHLQLQVVRGRVLVAAGVDGLELIQGTGRHKLDTAGQCGCVLCGRGLKNAVHPLGPVQHVVGIVQLRRAHPGNGLGGFQERVQAPAGGFYLDVKRDIGVGANNAPCGQHQCFHFQGMRIGGRAQIAVGQGRVLPRGYFAQVGQGGTVNQVQGFFALALFQLKLGHLLCRRACGQKGRWYIQQFTHAGVEALQPVLGVKHHNALADTGQGNFQQVRVLLHLGVDAQQFGFGALTLADVGVGADHAQRPLLCVAADNHAAGQHPFPRTVFAAQPKVDGVGIGMAV